MSVDSNELTNSNRLSDWSQDMFACCLFAPVLDTLDRWSASVHRGDGAFVSGAYTVLLDCIQKLELTIVELQV